VAVDGQALMAKMLHDDRARGSQCSVLMATHAGALLYSSMGYERIGTLMIFGPKPERLYEKPFASR